MEERVLTLGDGSRLQWLDKDPALFIDQTIAIYGRRKSGKSTLIDDIMYILRNEVSVVFVISQTASSTNPYEGKLPRSCVKNNVSKEWLESLVSNQKKRALIYNTANNEKTLQNLFKRIQSGTSTALYKNIVLKANQKLRTLDESNLQYAQKRLQKNEIQKMMRRALVTLYKKEISHYSAELLKQELTKEERVAVQYVNYNPRVLLVFDDCASVFKKWTKESPLINEIFYNGRWLYFTVIISTQTDKVVSTELRGNAMINIFTNKEAAITNFNRQSNGYTKEDRQRAAVCVEGVFGGGSDDHNFKKLVFLPFEDGDLFRYTVAEVHEAFQMCSPIIWDLAQTQATTEPDHESIMDSFLGLH